MQEALPLKALRPLRTRLGWPGAMRLAWALLGTAGPLLRASAGLGGRTLLQPWSRRLLKALRVQVALESPLPAGAPLWVANHLSWLDPMVLLSLRSARVLAKVEVAAYPLVGPASARAGLRFVDRRDPLSRAAALAWLGAALKRGEPLLLFPEGTTTRGNSLGRLHDGGLLAAHRLGVPTLPLRLDCEAPHYPWTGDAELLPHLRTLAAGEPVRVRVRPGPCLHPGDFQDPHEWIIAHRSHLTPLQRHELEPSI
ncbi:MAG: 1-acyl-sn-glycerol-3-phosphate acyltransferase [Acidobacteria bacterium]|nr:1-acyl-sn-glycerol-3-phosphate acyltransferase [Acidobacteriota bacterium]